MRNKMKSFKRKHMPAHRARVQRIKRMGKKPLFTVPIATFMVLLVAVMVAFLISSGGSTTLKPNNSDVVIINYDKKERTIPTRAHTVGELIKRLDIELHPGDVVEPSQDAEIIGDNFRINVYRAVPVTIVDGDQKTFTYSAAATPRSIVKQSGVEVFPEDKLELLPTENFLTESSIGERVVINRATPVTFNLYGTPATIRTHAKTVGELVKERGVKLEKDDSVQPSMDTPLTVGAQVFLIRKGTQLQTAEEALPMPVEEVQDGSLTFGASAVRQQGAPGKKLVTYQVELQNGQEVGRKKIQEVVIQEPVKQITAKGKAFNPSADKTSAMAAAGIASSDYAYADYIITRESGWCHTKWQGEFGNCPAYHGTPTSAGTGYGLCQSTPGYKMASAGADWGNNPITQLKWCDGYAKGRTFGSYGKGWYAAYRYWQDNSHW
ncbi:MAG: ubiquitin-like domain-containing protein [Candidatus Saccharimonadales bacterium]